MKEINGFPRRNQIDCLTIPETVISMAIERVERMDAHPLLTEAVILLGQAKNKVADYIEQENWDEDNNCPKKETDAYPEVMDWGEPVGNEIW